MFYVRNFAIRNLFVLIPTVISLFALTPLAVEARTTGDFTESFCESTLLPFSSEESIRKIAEEAGIPAERLSTSRLRAESKELWIRRFWESAVDGDVTYERLISEKYFEEMVEQYGLHPTEIYSLETAKFFKEMLRFVDEIPNRGFELKLEDISEAHRLAMQAEKPVQQFFSKVFPFLRGYLFDAGAVKKRRQFAVIDKPLTETQFNNILSSFEEIRDLGIFKSLTPENKALYRMKVVRKKVHRDGKISGVLAYPSAKIMEEALGDLIDWTNLQMQKIREGASDRWDPIDLAAVFQYAFVYLHPMTDGNGRASKVWRDKILEVFGFLPEHRVELWHDLDLTLEEHINLTRLGIHLSIERTKEIKESLPPSVATRAYGLEREESKEYSFTVSRKLQPKNMDQVFFIGKNREGSFVFYEDGFWYDHTGVPYVFRAEEKKLYPIADLTMPWYGYGGKVRVEGKVRMRESNEAHMEAFRNNLELAIRLVDDEKFGSEIEIVSYQEIQSANDEGQMHFYPWQKKLVNRAVRIDENPETEPFEVLAQTRGNPIVLNRSGTTTFEAAFIRGWSKFRPGDVIGQYEQRDLDLRKLALYLKRHHPDWFAEYRGEILESRRKLHRAARLILEEMGLFEDLNLIYGANPQDQQQFSPEFVQALSNRLEMRMLRDYLSGYSKLSYRSFDEALKHVDDSKIYVFRIASASQTEWLGLRSEERLGEIVTKVPLIESIAKEVYRELEKAKRGSKSVRLSHSLSRRIYQLAEKNPGFRNALEALVTRLLISPYQHRGLEMEFQRELVTMTLHANGYAPQSGFSTTVSPTYLGGNRKFINERIEAKIFLFEFPIRDVVNQRGGLWRGQYEVYLRRSYGTLRTRRMIKERYSEGSFEKVESAELLEEIENYLKNLYVDPEKIRKSISVESTKQAG